MENNVLKAPANHNLVDIFKELKYGRPTASQKYLDKCIKELTTVGLPPFTEYLRELKNYEVDIDLNSFTPEELEKAAKKYAYDKLLNFINKTFKTEL